MDSKYKNILIVIASLEHGGGAEYVASTTGRALVEKGNNVHYLCFYHEEDLYEHKGVYCSLNENKDYNSAIKAIFLFKRAYKIKRYVQKNNIDVVISHMEEANFAVSLANKIYSLNKNLIATVHTNPFSRSSFYRMMMRILYSNFNTIVSCSEGVGKILQDNIGLNNIKVIYNPIDLEEAKIKSSKPIAKKYQQYFKTNPVYINIGRLTEAKGQFHLIRSFSKVLKENPDAKLIILGEGELRAQLEKLIKRLNLKDKVLLLGNQDNVFPFLKQADCFVSSSLWEGLQITLIEALAVGTPVISTDCPTGPREIIAPNLSLGGKIDYPHYSKNGTLTRPFGIGGVSTSKMSLTSEESMLAEEMLSAVQRNKKSKEFYSLKRFMLKKIVDKWIRLINIKT